MSVHDRHRKWRCLTRLSAVALATMATAVSTVSARGLSYRDSLQAMIATAGTNRKAVAAPAAGRVLGGFTSQGWPVVVEISKNLKTIARVGTGLDMSCTTGISLQVPDGWLRLPISASGRVHARAAMPPSPGSGVSLTGGTTGFSGRLNRERSTFSGVWHVHLTFSTSNGQIFGCDSGRVTFTTRL